jgi:hypothetical protein
MFLIGSYSFVVRLYVNYIEGYAWNEVNTVALVKLVIGVGLMLVPVIKYKHRTKRMRPVVIHVPYILCVPCVPFSAKVEFSVN